MEVRHSAHHRASPARVAVHGRVIGPNRHARVLGQLELPLEQEGDSLKRVRRVALLQAPLRIFSWWPDSGDRTRFDCDHERCSSRLHSLQCCDLRPELDLKCTSLPEGKRANPDLRDLRQRSQQTRVAPCFYGALCEKQRIAQIDLRSGAGIE